MAILCDFFSCAVALTATSTADQCNIWMDQWVGLVAEVRVVNGGMRQHWVGLTKSSVSLLRSCLFEGETPPFLLPCLCESPKTLKYLRLTLPLCRSMATQVSSAPRWSQRHGLTGYALCSNLLILKFCKTNPFFLMLCI